MAKKKWKKKNKTAAEEMYEHLPKPIPPMSTVMGNSKEKRVKKFDYNDELMRYDE
jgi:hypothetical protein